MLVTQILYTTHTLASTVTVSPKAESATPLQSTSGATVLVICTLQGQLGMVHALDVTLSEAVLPLVSVQLTDALLVVATF